jgi:hypothetical protein
MTRHKVIDWFEPAIPSSAKIQQIDKFDARGMRRVYSIGNRIGSQTFYLYIWVRKDGQMFARFWSRCEEVDWFSYEITGLKNRFIVGNPDDGGVPLVLRKEYDSWVIAYLSWY